MNTRLIAANLLYGFLFFLAAGCEKIESHYYEDKETPGVAVFSNTGNNVMSCFTNGRSWKTLTRKTGTGFGTGYVTELSVRRQQTAGLLDTLSIIWRGDQNNPDPFDIMLTLPFAKNFQWKDIAAFQGKRIVVDSTNGYFSLVQSYNLIPSYSGKGVVYFNIAYIDSISPGQLKGRISGLLQADFAAGNNFSLSVTSGRFDDNVSYGEIRGY